MVVGFVGVECVAGFLGAKCVAGFVEIGFVVVHVLIDARILILD